MKGGLIAEQSRLSTASEALIIGAKCPRINLHSISLLKARPDY